MGEYCWKIEKKDSVKNNGDRMLGALNILGNLFDSLQWKFIHTAEREKYWNQQFQKSYRYHYRPISDMKPKLEDNTLNTVHQYNKYNFHKTNYCLLELAFKLMEKIIKSKQNR